MRLLKKLFAPKEVKAALGILDEQRLIFNFRAFEKISDKIESIILQKPSEFALMIQNGAAPRKWIFSIIANMAGDLVESGEYHVWRGLLNPMDDGAQLLRLYEAAVDELVRIGALDAAKATEQKRIIMVNINDVG